MSYRNPQLIKNTVSGAGMGQAIAGAISDVGGAIVTRTQELEAEDLRIAEREAVEDAAELERYRLSLEETDEERKAIDEANKGYAEYNRDVFNASIEDQYKLQTELEADGVDLKEKKRITKLIYEEKQKRKGMVEVIGGIGAAREEAIGLTDDVNFPSNASKAFYEWSKEQGGWKLNSEKKGFVTITNGKESYEIPNQSFKKGSFKIGSATPDVMESAVAGIDAFTKDTKTRAFGKGEAGPQYLADTTAMANTLTNKTMANVMSYALTDKAAFEGILAKKLGLSDEDIKAVNANLYSGDPKKVGMANAVIMNNISNRVNREISRKTGLVRSKDGTFGLPAEKAEKGFTNSKTWTKGQWSIDLRTKTSGINSKDDVFAQLGVIAGITPADGPGDQKVAISGDNNNLITISRVNPKQVNTTGDPKPMGKGTTYDFSKKSNVMAYLKNTAAYPAGLEAEIGALADQIVKQYQ